LYLGVIGLVLIVAGREYLLALIGRVLIAAGHEYARGDWIEAGNISGKVVGIGLLHTQVAQRMTAGGRKEIVPLSNATIFHIPLFVLPAGDQRNERSMNDVHGGRV
jgi:small-conductance mechanosensitive channel